MVMDRPDKRTGIWHEAAGTVLWAIGFIYLLIPFAASLPNDKEASEEAIYGVLVPAQVIPEGGKRIDTHCHYIPPFYSAILRSKGLDLGGRPIPEWTPEGHIEFMDSIGVQTGVVSVSAPGVLLPGIDVEDARKLARRLNEYGHKLSVEYPGRFMFFATLTLPDVEGSIAEAIYALDTLKAAGVILFGNHDGEYLGGRKFESLMAVLEERKAVVFVHPSTIAFAPVPGIPQFVLDFLLDTTRAAAHLVIKNVTGRYPNVRFILSHSGGFMPFAAYRIGAALSFITQQKGRNIMLALRSFYVDTALSSSQSALPSTLQFIPHNQITFGSDFPFAPTFGIKIATSELDEYKGVDAETKQWINYENADILLRKHLNYWKSVWDASASATSVYHEEL